MCCTFFSGELYIYTSSGEFLARGARARAARTIVRREVLGLSRAMQRLIRRVETRAAAAAEFVARSCTYIWARCVNVL